MSKNGIIIFYLIENQQKISATIQKILARAREIKIIAYIVSYNALESQLLQLCFFYPFNLYLLFS